MEEDIKVLKEVQWNCLHLRQYKDETAERKAEAIENILNELERLQKENALKNEKTVHTCLHCGKDTPLYCEKCYQELISKNAKLQIENEKLKNDISIVGVRVKNKRDGKYGVILRIWETGQIAVLENVAPMVVNTHDSFNTLEFDINSIIVNKESDYIPKQVIRDKLKDIELAIAFCENENRFKELIIKKGCLKELLGE